MNNSVENPNDPGPDSPILMATIDVGAHAARMLIAQAKKDHSFEVLEDLEQPVPLGANVFKRGRISNKSIRLLCDIFQNFRQKMDEYGIKHYKAITTSAVREASNSDIFLDQIYHASGIKLRIFQGNDCARLDYLTATIDLPAKYGFRKKRMMVADIGTGACQVSVYDKGNINFTETIRIGTLRILDQMTATVTSPGMQELLTPFVSKSFNDLEHISYDLNAETLIAMGSSVRALARLTGQVRKNQKSLCISRRDFKKVFAGATKNSVEELTGKYSISHDMAEAVTPGCLILNYLFQVTGAENLIIPMTSTKDALLKDFIMETFSGGEDYFTEQISSIVKRLAAKYKCLDEYTENVALFSERIFNKLQPLHLLGHKELLLLKLASYLHKSGLFISNRAYHKHSYYLVESSDIPGLSDRQRHLVAAISRYHRKAFPKSSHLEYMSLSVEDRSTVNKLAAILRLACGLANACGQDIKMSIRIHPEVVTMKLDEGTDILMENSFLENDANLFNYVYTRKLVFG